MSGAKQFDPQEALDKATELFRRKGFAATSMQDIVDELGVGRGSLYQTFGNKQALYIAALNNYKLQRYQRFHELFGDAPSAKEGIRKILSYLVTGLGRNGCLVSNTILERAIHDPESEAEATHAVEHNIEMLTMLLQQAQEEGDFPTERDPKRTARYLQTGMQGLNLMVIINPDQEQLQFIADDLFLSLFPKG